MGAPEATNVDTACRFVPDERSASGLASAGVESHVRYCLRAILLTRRGERRARPLAGSTTATFLWRPLEPGLRLELESAIRQAVSEGEPRVQLESVAIENDRANGARLRVQLTYRLLDSNKRDRLEVSL
jgi:phage baseplate assembly protein W